MIKVIELFAGVGSQTQALKNIGIEHEVVGIAEIDKYAISSYMQLHGETPLLGDITTIESLPDADLWTYSFPCQDISVAGKGLGIKEGTRSGLLSQVERLLESSVKPKYLLMENVKNLIGKNHKPAFDVWCKKLEELGYKNFYQVLNSKDFGVPQNRERVFMVSLLQENEYIFPQKEELNIGLKDILEENVEEKYYLSKKIIDRFKFYPETTDKLGKINVLGTTAPDKKIGQRDLTYGTIGIMGALTATDYKQPKQILQIGTIKESDKGWDNPQTSRIYSSVGISPTLNTCGGGQREPKILTEAVANNFKIRKLTPRECWRLMGWSDEQFNKIKGISNAQLYKQAGNGIVVNVLEAIFKNLFKK
ncbi:MAG: DNA cytosine methyltransferase [Fusobacteriaceae bacterium]